MHSTQYAPLIHPLAFRPTILGLNQLTQQITSVLVKVFCYERSLDEPAAYMRLGVNVGLFSPLKEVQFPHLDV
jgi:hypothetical protein